MKTIFKCVGLCLLVSIWLQSCNKEEDADTTPPQRVEALTAIPQNQAVLLQWTNPSDNDLKQIEITYNGKSEIAVNESGKRIEGLENGKEYTFSLIAVDRAGNKSEAVTVKATPDQYVNVLQGTAPISGTYLYSDQFSIEIVYDNNNFKQTLTAGSSQYIWEGSLNVVNDTTYRFTKEYYSIDYRGRTHIANIVEDVNAVCCFTYQNKTYYLSNCYEKKSGKEGFLSGKYRRYSNQTSNDWNGVNNRKEYCYVDVDDSGKMTYLFPDSTPAEYTWTNADLLENNIFFVSFNSRIYLVNTQVDLRYQKQ